MLRLADILTGHGRETNHWSTLVRKQAKKWGLGRRIGLKSDFYLAGLLAREFAIFLFNMAEC